MMSFRNIMVIKGKNSSSTIVEYDYLEHEQCFLIRKSFYAEINTHKNLEKTILYLKPIDKNWTIGKIVDEQFYEADDFTERIIKNHILSEHCSHDRIHPNKMSKFHHCLGRNLMPLTC
jgi:hypothetical protein